MALGLAGGLSPTDLADSRGVSLPTVRTQIRQALAKTSANGIAQLVALVSSLPRHAGRSDDKDT